MTKTSADSLKKWSNNLKAATSYMQQGVNAVQQSPAQQAVAKKDKFRANLLASIDNGVWEAGLSKVTLQQWKDSMNNKGIGRVSAGVDGAQGKMGAFFNWLIPTVQQSQAKLATMPDLTLQDRLNKMVAHATFMSQNKYRTKSS